MFWCLEGHVISRGPGDWGHLCVWSFRCSTSRDYKSVCVASECHSSVPVLKRSVRVSFHLIILPAFFHLWPLQKAMHRQLPASDEVKHIETPAHSSLYYHKCQQSSSSLLLLLQWWKCQMHLQQSEHRGSPKAPQPAISQCLEPSSHLLPLVAFCKSI